MLDFYHNKNLIIFTITSGVSLWARVGSLGPLGFLCELAWGVMVLLGMGCSWARLGSPVLLESLGGSGVPGTSGVSL